MSAKRVRQFVILGSRGDGAWALVTALVLLPIAAFASPVDPAWIEGIYDGADGDKLVLHITETFASSDGVATYRLFLPIIFTVGVNPGPRVYADSRTVPPARSPPQTFRQAAEFCPNTPLLNSRRSLLRIPRRDSWSESGLAGSMALRSCATPETQLKGRQEPIPDPGQDLSSIDFASMLGESLVAASARRHKRDEHHQLFYQGGRENRPRTAQNRKVARTRSLGVLRSEVVSATLVLRKEVCSWLVDESNAQL
jgi:hypothetical protein